MSNYFDLYCKTCNVKANAFHWNWGNERLRDLIPVLDQIAQFALAMPADFTLSIGCSAETSSWSDLVEFANNHSGPNHEVRVRSEYGEIDGDCNARFPCRECDHDRRCILPFGHDGHHSGAHK